MTRSTTYRWAALELDEAGDIVENSGYATLCAARRACQHWASIAPGETRYAIELVRDQSDDVSGVVSRTWARITDGRLPTIFDNGKRVPARFRKECEMTLECTQ